MALDGIIFEVRDAIPASYSHSLLKLDLLYHLLFGFDCQFQGCDEVAIGCPICAGCLCKGKKTKRLQPFNGCNSWAQSAQSSPKSCSRWTHTWVCFLSLGWHYCSMYDRLFAADMVFLSLQTNRKAQAVHYLSCMSRLLNKYVSVCYTVYVAVQPGVLMDQTEYLLEGSHTT